MLGIWSKGEGYRADLLRVDLALGCLLSFDHARVHPLQMYTTGSKEPPKFSWTLLLFR